MAVNLLPSARTVQYTPASDHSTPDATLVVISLPVDGGVGEVLVQ